MTATLATISQHYRPITFTATCPTCAHDADWCAFVARDPDQNGSTVHQPWTPHNHIDCPRCGPCPCDFHDNDPYGGVPA